VVARRGDLLIAETAHGFVCANAGVDASNVPAGFVSLLPVDPDGSAGRIRRELAARLGVDRLGVVVTDTFGRPWRAGVVNVAIGCAGLPALVDLRGRPDHLGRALEVTVVALADEVAAATGLVMGKADRVPVAIVRGVDISVAAPGSAAELVRPAEEDLFRTSPLEALLSASRATSFGDGDVPPEALDEAVRAASAALAPGSERSRRFVVVRGATERHRLVDAAIGSDPDPEGSILRAAPVLIVPWIRFPESDAHDDLERTHAVQERSLLDAGAAILALMVALQARGLATAWSGSTLFHQLETRAALSIDDPWFAIGAIAVGPAVPLQAGPPAPVDVPIVEIR
jgi:coenzyme F420-0:L-glutamate ligase/coenzyme F420-1:gamma-L-glutamate ligase